MLNSREIYCFTRYRVDCCRTRKDGIEIRTVNDEFPLPTELQDETVCEDPNSVLFASSTARRSPKHQSAAAKYLLFGIFRLRVNERRFVGGWLLAREIERMECELER